MKFFTVYNSSGKILRSGSCQDSVYEMQAGPEENILEGAYSDTEFFVVDGVIRKIPERPKEDWIFDFSTGEWVQPEFTAIDRQEAFTQLRDARDELLKRSDWTQVPDAPVDHTAWATYRQELRDLPSKTADPRYPVWPIPPTK